MSVERSPTGATVGSAVAALLVAAAVAEIGWVLWLVVAHPPSDLAIYRWGGHVVGQGTTLYTAKPYGHFFTYPPFAAALFVLLARLPDLLVRVGWGLLSVGALVVAGRAALRLADERRRRVALLVLVVAVFVLQPLRLTFEDGQVNLLILAVVLTDLDLARTGRRWAGIGIGLAAAVKLTPAVFVLVLLAGRRVRAAVVAGVTFALCAGVAAVVAPAASRLYWTQIVFHDTSRVGAPYISNQSPYGAALRLAGGADHVGAWYAVIPVVLLVGGVVVGGVFVRRGRWLEAAVAGGTTSLLVSPISWTHHWVWVVPALLLLVRRGGVSTRVAAAAAYVVFLLAPMFWTPWHGGSGEYGFHGPQSLVANCYLALGAAFLGYLCLLARGRDASPQDDPRPTPAAGAMLG